MPGGAASLIQVGRTVSVYGVKGWVKVISFTEPREEIFGMQPWHLTAENGQVQTVSIDDGRVQGAGLVVHIQGIDDRDVARQFCQKEIWVDRQWLPPLEEGRYYWHQLVGLKVISTFAGRQCLLGNVRQMVETGANDVMIVEPCDGSLDKRERWLPYLTGQYGIAVDLSAGELRIDWDPDF